MVDRILSLEKFTASMFATKVRDMRNEHISLELGLDKLNDILERTRISGNTVWLIGNGGSATIASHISEDLIRKGIPSRTLNDAALLTMLANDYGHVNMFAQGLDFCAKMRDVLIAISSSGESTNISRACRIALTKEMTLVTFTGFRRNNPVDRIKSSLSFYVPAYNYGHVELTHEALLHTLIDANVDLEK